MGRVRIHDLLDGKWEDGTRPKDIFSIYVMRDPAGYAEDIIQGLKSENRRVQSGCAELASLLSEREPVILYQYLETFQKNLLATEPVVRWEAVCTLGNLACADDDQRIRQNVEKIAEFLKDRSIVLQGHAARALAKIATAFPDLSPRILDRLINSKDCFPGNRIGFIIESARAFGKDKRLAAKVRRFVEPYIASDIKSVASKARKTMKSVGPR